MSTPRKRRSLRDRNEEAIAGPPIEDPTTQSPTAPISPPTNPVQAPTTPPPARPESATPRRAGAPRNQGEPTVRIGIYFHSHQFDAAKAGYLGDWQHGGEADTFARWISGALNEHAERTPAQRADLAATQTRADTSGSTRSFTLPEATMVRMREAITADQHAGRWPSDSAWCGEAIAAAVDQARTRTGGTLPTPPARLPNRLAR